MYGRFRWFETLLKAGCDWPTTTKSASLADTTTSLAPRSRSALQLKLSCSTSTKMRRLRCLLASIFNHSKVTSSQQQPTCRLNRFRSAVPSLWECRQRTNCQNRWNFRFTSALSKTQTLKRKSWFWIRVQFLNNWISSSKTSNQIKMRLTSHSPVSSSSRARKMQRSRWFATSTSDQSSK